MFSLRGRKGNYSYACARVKAKKSLLLEKDNYPKLLMMDLNEIGRFLGETQYKEEMTELASRYDGVNLIELGTSRNLARMYTQVLSFTTGDLTTWWRSTSVAGTCGTLRPYSAASSTEPPQKRSKRTLSPRAGWARSISTS